jgi:hypothetical protein
MAWAEAAKVPAERVAAGFYQVAEDRLDLVSEAPDADALTRLVAGLGQVPV